MIFTSLLSLQTRNKQDKCVKSNNDTVCLILSVINSIKQTVSNSFDFISLVFAQESLLVYFDLYSYNAGKFKQVLGDSGYN